MSSAVMEDGGVFRAGSRYSGYDGGYDGGKESSEYRQPGRGVKAEGRRGEGVVCLEKKKKLCSTSLVHASAHFDLPCTSTRTPVFSLTYPIQALGRIPRRVIKEQGGGEIAHSPGRGEGLMNSP